MQPDQRSQFVCGLRANDPEAWKELYNRLRNESTRRDAIGILIDAHGAVLRAIIRGKLKESTIRRLYNTSDLLQSSLLRIHKCVHEDNLDLNDPGSLQKYLNQAVRHRVAEAHRTHTAQERDQKREVYGEPALAEVAAPPPDGADPEELEALLARVPPRVREVVRKRLAGQSWAEIARAFGVMKGTLRRRIQRAMGHIRPRTG